MKGYSARTRTRALITGGAGFRGSYLCERPLADGHDVICLDDTHFELMRHLSSHCRSMSKSTR